jgi:ribosome-associated protein
VIRVTDEISIDEGEITYDFIRSPGPGGQKVNKTATTVQLRFDAANSPSLEEEVRERLISLAGRRATTEGELVITARRHRTREMNRKDALGRLLELIEKASRKPRRRKKTRPPLAAGEKRLEGKRRRGAAKRLRKPAEPENGA